MHAFWEIVASNALLAVALAIGVALLGRVWRNPVCLHLLWLLVLLKLVTPPLLPIPLALPAWETGDAGLDLAFQPAGETPLTVNGISRRRRG